MGAWIEMDISSFKVAREKDVAPLVGAWIEIQLTDVEEAVKAVAPLVGAWIEIVFHSTGKRGFFIVAPLVGAWIEIRET